MLFYNMLSQSYVMLFYLS